MKKFLLILLLLISSNVHAVSVGPAMNVSGQGSDYIFVYRGNNPNEFDSLVAQGLNNLSGWTATCTSAECAGTSYVIDHATQPDSDTLLLYTRDSSGNVAWPDSGRYYSFASPPPPPVIVGGGSVSYDSNITNPQTIVVNSAKTNVGNLFNNNSINLDVKTGSANNSTTIEQTGFYNRISGLGADYAVLNGSSNNINIKQGDGGGKNQIEFSIAGDSNTISVWQARSPSTGLQDGSESGGHYLGLNVSGNTNTVVAKQSNDGASSSGHFALIDIVGNSNQGSLKQSGNGEKIFFGVVNGNSNVFDISQQGNGSYLDLALSGNGHSVIVNQRDAGSHKATINLTNIGGASTVGVVQQGSSAQNINITQQCATLSGCSVSVTQGQQ